MGLRRRVVSACPCTFPNDIMSTSFAMQHITSGHKSCLDPAQLCILERVTSFTVSFPVLFRYWPGDDRKKYFDWSFFVVLVSVAHLMPPVSISSCCRLPLLESKCCHQTVKSRKQQREGRNECNARKQF